MSIEGQGHFFTIYWGLQPRGFVCFVLYQAKISGERLQDHWSSGLRFETVNVLKCQHQVCFNDEPKSGLSVSSEEALRDIIQSTILILICFQF